MCRALKCSYQELMGLPESIYSMWAGFLIGENRAAEDTARAQAAKSG